MANSHFFNPEAPETLGTQAPHCIACQALLTDALDGNLGEIDQTWFDRHVRTCAECGEQFADAQRGVAWLDVLKSSPLPEPSADLMERILAQTSLAQTSLAPTIRPAPALAGLVPATVLPFQPQPVRLVASWAHLPAALFEPRLAMTAAMALFSLALTMNLTGIQLGQLRPTSLRRTYYQSTAGVARYYDNLRVVRVLESRVDDLREENSDSNSEGQSAPAPANRPAPARPQSAPEPKTSRPGNGVSRREPSHIVPSDRPKTLYAQAGSWNAGGLV